MEEGDRLKTVTDEVGGSKQVEKDAHLSSAELTQTSSTTAENNKNREHYAWKIATIFFFLLATVFALVSLYVYWHSPEPNGPYNITCAEIIRELNKCQADLNEKFKSVTELQGSVKQLESTRSALLSTLRDSTTIKKNLETTKSDLEQRNAVMQRDNDELMAKFLNMKLRLSEIILSDANNDDTNFDKGEEYSRINIAEEFRRIYLYEYTDAVNEIEEKGTTLNTEKMTKYFMGLLKLAYDLCKTYSMQHLGALKQGIMTLQVQGPVDHEKQKYSQEESAFEDTDKTETVRMDHGYVRKTVNLTIEDTLSTKEWNSLFDIRRAAAVQLEDPLITILSDVIIRDFAIEPESSPKLMLYIKKCLHVCWMMNMHPKPVFLYFVEPSETTLFNADMFTSFLSAGKYIDYMVWPPLYSYDGGDMLAQGIAQGHG